MWVYPRYTKQYTNIAKDVFETLDSIRERDKVEFKEAEEGSLVRTESLRSLIWTQLIPEIPALPRM